MATQNNLNFLATNYASPVIVDYRFDFSASSFKLNAFPFVYFTDQSLELTDQLEGSPVYEPQRGPHRRLKKCKLHVPTTIWQDFFTMRVIKGL